jgi:hypothetical protein
VAEAIAIMGIFHTKNPKIAEIKNAIGKTILAGFEKTVIKTTLKNIGKNASNAYIKRTPFCPTKRSSFYKAHIFISMSQKVLFN